MNRAYVCQNCDASNTDRAPYSSVPQCDACFDRDVVPYTREMAAAESAAKALEDAALASLEKARNEYEAATSFSDRAIENFPARSEVAAAVWRIRRAWKALDDLGDTARHSADADGPRPEFGPRAYACDAATLRRCIREEVLKLCRSPPRAD